MVLNFKFTVSGKAITFNHLHAQNSPVHSCPPPRNHQLRYIIVKGRLISISTNSWQFSCRPQLTGFPIFASWTPLSEIQPGAQSNAHASHYKLNTTSDFHYHIAGRCAMRHKYDIKEEFHTVEHTEIVIRRVLVLSDGLLLNNYVGSLVRSN